MQMFASLMTGTPARKRADTPTKRVATGLEGAVELIFPRNGPDESIGPRFGILANDIPLVAARSEDEGRTAGRVVARTEDAVKRGALASARGQGAPAPGGG